MCNLASQLILLCNFDFDIGGDIASHPPPPRADARGEKMDSLLSSVITLTTDKEAV